MTRAVLKNGVICPLGALPPDWREGQELSIEAIDDDEMSDEEFEAGMRKLDAMCAENDPEDFSRMMQAIQASRELGKQAVRKQMGLQ